MPGCHGSAQKLHLGFKNQRPEEGEGWWGRENSKLSGLTAGLILFQASDAISKSGKKIFTASALKGDLEGHGE